DGQGPRGGDHRRHALAPSPGRPVGAFDARAASGARAVLGAGSGSQRAPPRSGQGRRAPGLDRVLLRPTATGVVRALGRPADLATARVEGDRASAPPAPPPPWRRPSARPPAS